MRITTEEQLNELVALIVAALPQLTEEAVKAFLDARLTAYNKDKRIDAHLKLKAGNTYLPYPYNVKLVGRLYDCVTGSSEQDEYDI
jgi:hypothetical protein